MTKNEIIKSLKELNLELKKSQLRGEIYLVGGAVMCLVFNARNSTKDLDALMKPYEEIQKAAINVSETLGLENNFWINDAAKVFFSDHGDFSQSDLSMSNLNIMMATKEYMFAMKALSARPGTQDESDIIFLKNLINLKDMTAALTIIKKYYPEDKLGLDSKILLSELFGEKP
jgi:hypothetical protein